MNALKNRVQLIGNLGLDPEVKPLTSGRKMARLRMATNETYVNAKGEKVTDTQWHSIVAWGKTADIVEKFMVKGLEVAVEGKLVNRSFTNELGEKRYFTEIEANNIMILSKKS